MSSPAGKILLPFVFVLYLLFGLPLGLVGCAMGLIGLPITCPILLYLLLRRALKQPQTVLDVNCISWALRTSLDKPTRLSAMKLLATATPLGYNLTLVVDCLDVLLRCVKVVDGCAVVVQELE